MNGRYGYNEAEEKRNIHHGASNIHKLWLTIMLKHTRPYLVFYFVSVLDYST